MKKLVLTLFALLMVSAFAAADTIVDFNTQGGFSGGACGVGTCSYNAGTNQASLTFANGAVLTFTGVANPTASTFATVTVHTLLADFANVTFGSFTITGGLDNTVNQLAGTNFVISITQFNPSSGNGLLPATLSGGLLVNQSTGKITFTLDPNQVYIGDIRYATDNQFYTLNGPDANLGVTTINGSVTVPEPASLALLGSGLLGAGGLIRKRFGV